MSRALMLVRFPDGQIQQGLYDGTSDTIYPWLVERDAWDLIYPLVRDKSKDHPLFRERSWDEGPETEIFAVEIYSNYGSGWVMHGKAARNRVVGELDALEYDWVDGRPDWVENWYRQAKEA